MRPSRVLSRVALVAVTTAVTLPALSLGAQAIEPPCIPSYTGYGPTVSVDVDYRNPANSSVGYDSSNVGLFFDLCL